MKHKMLFLYLLILNFNGCSTSINNQYKKSDDLSIKTDDGYFFFKDIVFASRCYQSSCPSIKFTSTLFNNTKNHCQSVTFILKIINSSGIVLLNEFLKVNDLKANSNGTRLDSEFFLSKNLQTDQVDLKLDIASSQCEKDREPYTNFYTIKFPKFYPGDNPLETINFLIKNNANKTEYEKTIDYNNRIDKMLGDKIYYFKVKNIKKQYDSDGEILSVYLPSIFGYESYHTSECDKDDWYYAKNAFGIQVFVTKCRGATYNIKFINNISYDIDNKKLPAIYQDAAINIAMDSKYAQSNKDDIQAIMACKLIADKKGELYNYLISSKKPTIIDKVELIDEFYDINSDPYELFIYNFKTGEILRSVKIKINNY